MLKIRLQRTGRKNQPSFRLLLVDSRRGSKTGNFKEILGFHNPLTKETKFESEKIKNWISKGAQVSDTVFNMLISQGVIEGKKKNVLPRKSPVVKEKEEGENKENNAKEDGGAPESEEKGDDSDSDEVAPEKIEEKSDEEPKEEPVQAEETKEEPTQAEEPKGEEAEKKDSSEKESKEGESSEEDKKD